MAVNPRKVVYAVQINESCVTAVVTCPNCFNEVEIFESHEERTCPSTGCEDIRFKIVMALQVFTGVKPTNIGDKGTCWECDGRGYFTIVDAYEQPIRNKACVTCEGTGRNQ